MKNTNNTSSLKSEHDDMVNKYLQQVNDKTSNSYMLTISRDGESPVRTIIFYQNAIDAAFAYNKYTDWGFAKNFLTVTLYEPTGLVNKKVLVRDQAGECTFVRQDYYDIQNILSTLENKIDKKIYDQLCIDIMTVFAKDNWRFNPERFLNSLNVDYIFES